MPNLLIKKILIFIYSAVLVFQFLLLFGLIPYKYTWGGRLNSKEEMYVFVSISILLNVLFLLTILIKANYLKIAIPRIILQAMLWFMVIVFALNTLGNLVAIQDLEKFIAAPITLILSILCFKIVIEK
jgi:hypothetical protein